MAKSRCAFSLKSGVSYEGYMLELENGQLRFGKGGPMASPTDLLISVEEIDLATLAYWNEIYGCYLDTKWDENLDKWTFQPSKRAT